MYASSESSKSPSKFTSLNEARFHVCCMNGSMCGIFLFTITFLHGFLSALVCPLRTAPRFCFPLGKIRSIMSAVRSIVSLLSLLSLFIFVFAVLGTHIFGGRFSPGHRSHFDTTWDAFLTVSQVTTGSWSLLLCLDINFFVPCNAQTLTLSLILCDIVYCSRFVCVHTVRIISKGTSSSMMY